MKKRLAIYNIILRYNFRIQGSGKQLDSIILRSCNMISYEFFAYHLQLFLVKF